MVKFLKKGFSWLLRCFSIPCHASHFQYQETNYVYRKRKGLVFLLSFFVVIVMVHKYVQPVRFIFIHHDINSTCLLPEINPFDSSVMKYIWHPEPIKCDPTPSMVYIDSEGILRYNSSIVNKLDNSSYNCVYRIAKRSTDFDVTFLPEVSFKQPVYIPADCVNVKCYVNNIMVFDGVLFNIDYKTVLANTNIKQGNNDSLNVLIFGLDSVSRLAAERKLIKTMDFIKNTLNGYVFKGYTSTASITYPNVIASLTGKLAYSSELPKLDPSTEFTDSYPFIWKQFAEKGYVTMFSEDFPEISIFNYLLKGFKDTPVDHYLRTYYMTRNKVHSVQSNLDQVFMFLEDKSIKVGKYSSLCYKDRPKHALHIDHFKQFVATYRSYRKFSFSWLTEISHDYMNNLELADEDIFQMLHFFHREGYLKNSVFIFMSDHGPRTDEIRNTAVGRIEERMPLLSLVVPEHIKRRYPNLEQTLKENENRLTSPFDLHETYIDILNNKYEQFDEINKRPFPRGISLFRKIPKERTCADAAIAEHFCACYTANNMSVDNPIIKTISTFVVNYINEELSRFKGLCAKLSLHNIQAAQTIETGLLHKVDYDRRTLLNLFYAPEEETEQRYLVLIETVPGNALFEATVSETNNNFKIMGDISRTNRYNNQSHCMSFKQYKHMCYCNDLL